jgi:hypothetical protein
MTQEPHPEVPEQIFNAEERNQEHEWHIFLTAIEPARIECSHHAISNEAFKDDLDDLDLIPESVQMRSVSFYFRGTFRDAYLKATRMCEELNEERDIGDAEFEFERGSIMKAE